MAELISARGFNIDSLTVSATEDPTISHMTIVVDADTVKLEQVKRQLDRLIDVIEVRELKDDDFIGRDLLLARVHISSAKRSELEGVLNQFGAKIAHESTSSVVIEAVDKTKTLDQLIEKLRGFGIEQLVRTGRVALERNS